MDASRIELHTTAVASAGEAMCAALAGEARPTAAAAAATLAAAAGVRVLAISHTLLPTGVGNGRAKEGDKTIPVGSLQFF